MAKLEDRVPSEAGSNAQVNIAPPAEPPAWMSAPAVISWVAFKDADAWAKWEPFTRSRLHRSWQEWGLPFGVVGLEGEARALLAAFRARAKGAPWCPDDEVEQPAYVFRAKVRRVMRLTELPAQQLAAELEEDIKVALELDGRLDSAVDAIVTKVRDRLLPAWGRSVAGWSALGAGTQHEKIEPALFLGPWTISRFGEVDVDTRLPEHEGQDYEGPIIKELHFLRDDVVALWPKQQTSRIEQTKTGEPGRPSQSHLAVNEFEQRVKAGVQLSTLAAEAAHLADWYTIMYPANAPLRQKTIENRIRAKYRAIQAPNAAPPRKYRHRQFRGAFFGGRRADTSSVRIQNRTDEPNMTTQKPLLVSGSTARKLLDIGTTKYWELIKQQRIETVQLTGRTMVVYSSLEALANPQDAT